MATTRKSPWCVAVLGAVLLLAGGAAGTSHDPAAPSEGYVYGPPAVSVPADAPDARGYLAAYPDGFSFVYAVQHPDAESTSRVAVSRSAGGRAYSAFPAAYLPAAAYPSPSFPSYLPATPPASTATYLPAAGYPATAAYLPGIAGAYLPASALPPAPAAAPEVGVRALQPLQPLQPSLGSLAYGAWPATSPASLLVAPRLAAPSYRPLLPGSPYYYRR